MKNAIFKRAISLLLALVCVVGILPLSAFADTGLSTAPSTITQSYCDYMYIGGRSVRYKSASDTINAAGLPYVFHEQVSVPGLDNTIRALCSYHAGSLGGGANGQKWNFKKEVDSPSLKLILTWVYSCTYGDFTEAGDAAGLTKWDNYWSDIWFLVSQAMTWYYEYGIIIDYTTDKEGFIKQAAEEFVAAVRMYNENEIVSSWITDWDAVTIYDIIDSADGGVTGNSAYDYIIAGMNAVLDHPEYYHDYHLWEYEWDTTQPWKLAGHSSTEMQRLLIAVPDREPDSRTVKLTIKKLEAGTNQLIPGVAFKIENVDDPSAFSATRQTGADGTITLTKEVDNLTAGQYRITEVAAPEGYMSQTESQLVTLLPDSSAENVFTFYNAPIREGEGSIRKVDSDNPTVGLPGAVIRITSVKLDGGGSFVGEYTTGDGGYISNEDLDFSTLPAGSYLAEEITPPEGYVLSSDLSKRRQTFVWDGETDVSLVFENSAKVKVELKKVDESGSPLAGAVFLVLRDGQIISTEETKADGTITVPNVSEGYYEFREVSAPAGFDCDRTPVGIHVSAEDLQGEQTITVTKVNYHKRPLTISKRDAETGAPVPGTSFHIRGVNVSYENDVVTSADGRAILPDMASGCYEITETNVPTPYLLDTNNRRTVWINASEGQDTVVDFVNSTRPGLRLVKTDHATGKPIAGVTFLIEQVGGGYSRQHATDENGLIVLENLEPGAYTVTEVKPAPSYVADTTPRAVWLEKNRTTTLELTNVRKPDLRILKYDQQSGKPLAGVTFEVWHDSELLGEYTTNESGEIYLSGLELGTYLVKEVATDDEHVVSTTPQQIELTADRTETAQLIFFNSKKPGIHLIKVDSVTMKPLPNVRFEFKLVGGSYRQEFTTDLNGEIDLSKLTPGTYEVRELEAPDGYLMDDAVRVVRVNPDEDASFVFTNTPKPALRVIKTSSDGSRLGGVHFRIARIEDGTHYLDRITDVNGEINISGLEPGVYSIQETATVSDHIMDLREYHVELFAGQTSTLTIENQKRPNLIVYKNDADTGEPVPNTVFLVKAADGHSVNEIKTDKEGKATLANLLPGVYEISEKSVPAPWLMDAPSQLVTLYANRDHTVYFKNHKKPTLTINKVDSVTGSPIKGAKFQVWYGSNSTATGELNSLGTFYSNADGQIVIDNLRDGWYKVTELEPAAGYTIKQPATQEFYIKGGESKTVTFENVPKNAIALEKYDSVTHEALPGCTFQLKYLGGTSGTGGTVIGQKVTDKNGTAIWTGLNPGTYILEEIDPADGYNIIQSSETILLADNGEQSVVTVKFNNAPDGILLVRKVCATNPSVTLQNAEFKIMYADGTLIGDSNGIFRSDENGEIRIEGLKPGKSVIVTEVKAPAGFILDTQSQTIQIKEGRTVSLTFKNQPRGKLIVQKRDSQTGEVLPGAEFRITTAAGCEVGLDGVIGTSSLTQNGIFTTDSQGEIRISNLAPGAYVISEIKAPSGYVIDTPSTNVVIGTGGDTQTVVIKDTKKGNLVVEKYDSVIKQPLSGARFKITTANGELVAGNEGMTSSNGLYTTDRNGQIVLSKLLPGTYVVTEDRAPDNYRADPTPQTVVVNAGDTQTVKFYNDPLCTLTILKRDAVTKKPLQGAEFLVTDSSGHVIGPNNGLYTTGADGTVTVTGLAPNSTVMVSEKRAPSGYILDGSPKNIVVRSGAANNLTIDNEPSTTLIIRKFIEGTENEPLSGVTFKVVDGSGAAIGPDDGIYQTDQAGEIVLEGIEPGTTAIVREIKTVEGYVLDGHPQDIKIVGGRVQQLTFWNKKAGTLVVQKKDSVSGAPISGAQFQLTYANGGYVDNDNGHLSSNGLYTTDQNGKIRISGIVGTVVVKEIQAAPGYMIDSSTQTQTVTVNPMDTQTLVFVNEPLCSLTITKLDSVTGKPVPNTQFAVKDGNGNVLATCTTGKDGTATVTGLIPNSTVIVVETKVPSGYVLDSTPKTITVKNGTGNRVTVGSGSTVTTPGSSSGGNDLTFENDPKQTLTIHKYIEGTKNEPLAGVAFKVVDGSGAPVGTGDGTFYTNAAGEIVITGLEPGTTVTAREIKTAEGFVLDGTPKSVQIKAGQPAPELTFWNAQAGELVIRKLDSVTKKPLAGVEFELTYAGGGYVDAANGHLSSNGLYITDSHGEIHISGITGTIVAKETRTIPGYIIDEATRTQTVKVNPQDTQVLTFYNAPKQTLTIQKYVDGTTTPIQGVTFLVTDSSGAVVGPNNGEFITDRNGRIVITGLTPGATITAKETKTVSGYVLDPTPQSILIKQGAAQTMTFYNKAEGGLELIKVSEANPTQRIPGVTFEIRRMDGGLVKAVTTDANGRACVSLDVGDYYAVETEAAQGFKLDNVPHYFTVRDGKTTTLTVKNKPLSGILIHKTDSVTGKGLYGVSFVLYDSKNTPIGQYSSDNSGYVYIEDLTEAGRYYLRELDNPGYVPDTELKTVYVKAGETTLVEWQNTPITGQIQITKTSSDYNSINGWPAGTPIPNTEFEIYDYRTGNLVDTVRTDKNGVAVSSPLPLGRYKIVESKAADFYSLDQTPIEADLEYAGQIVKAAMTNKPLYTNVSIKKTGYAEVMAGQNIRYTFSDIGSNSTVPLSSFYWRDTLPTQAVRLGKIYTGTYNATGNYKVVYKTNLNGEYRTMYDSLSTSQNYTLDASPAALGLASNEYVTEFMLVFGVVPANFRQVEAPKVDCTVLSTVKGGSQFTNAADVGGVYNGQWIQAVTRWTTSVYGKPAKLPKTGY